MEKHKISKKRKFSLFFYLNTMSLRARLILTFIILILSSATATIFIGRAVLGTEIFELAKQKADVDLNVAHQMWKLKKQEIAYRISSAVENYSKNAHLYIKNDTEDNNDESEKNIIVDRKKILESFIDKSFFDFIGIVNKDGVILEHIPAIESNKPRKTPIKAVLEAASKNTQLVSAISVKVSDVEIEAPQLKESLNDFQNFGEVMIILSASAVEINGKIEVLYGGYLVNGKNELVNRMNQVAIANHNCTHTPCSAATIFHKDKRIATSLDPKYYETPILSVADKKVVEQVLKNKGNYIGVAGVVGKDFYAAYRPIIDYTGDAIGMLGIGTTVAEYQKAQDKTTLLFSSLILGGMIFGFIMTYIFSAWLVKPMAQLAEGMSRVAEGDLNYKVRIQSTDELGKVAKAFNRMIKAVKERDNRLREITESRLSEVEKQISIGRLAAGVAHEINNPLTAILSLSTLLLRNTSDEDKKREDLEIIVEETTRCREIVSSLLDFAREKPTSKKIVDINQVIKDTLSLANKYESLKHANISINSKISPLLVEADAKQLQQVFTNLFLNASEAVSEAEASDKTKQGKIEIAIDEDSSGEYAQVQVSDNGIGISEEKINSIFEPFFTTKGKSKGTGLGLSVSLGIVKKHNGVIEVESEEGKGTSVTVILPVYSEENNKKRIV